MRRLPLPLSLSLPALPAFAASLLTLAGCSGTGQPEVAYQAFALPEAPGSLEAGDWTVTLDKATLAFGPVYFCASSSGSSADTVASTIPLADNRAAILASAGISLRQGWHQVAQKFTSRTFPLCPATSLP